MAWIATNKNGETFVFSEKPIKCEPAFMWGCLSGRSSHIKGDLAGLLFKNIPTWDDEAVEINEIDLGKLSHIEGESLNDELSRIKEVLEQRSRKALIDLIANENVFVIPKRNGKHFILGMIDMNFRTFYFYAVVLIDGALHFLGHKDNNKNVPFLLSEHDLPDNGLLYIYEYLVDNI